MKKFALSFALISTGCGIVQSETKQLHNDSVKCFHYDAGEIDQRLSKADSFISKGFQPDTLKIVRNQLAGIPDTYISFMIEASSQRGFEIKPAEFLNGAAGVTTSAGQGSSSGSMVWYPTNISLLQDPTQVEHAAQHEYGHAIENYFISHFDKQDGDTFNGGLKKEALAHANNPNASNYARGYYGRGENEAYFKEYFAEAFNSFYCSPESQDKLKEEGTNSLKSTFEWLHGFLEPARWDDGKDEDEKDEESTEDGSNDSDDNSKSDFVKLYKLSNSNHMLYAFESDVSNPKACFASNVKGCTAENSYDLERVLSPNNIEGRPLYSGKIGFIRENSTYFILYDETKALKVSF